MTDQNVIQWLLESDPAIRWQVMKHLQNIEISDYQEERQKISHTGWGAEILSRQDADGLWNNRLYIGKWISTTYSLYTLMLLGLPPENPQAIKGCQQLFDQGLYNDKEIRFSRDQKIRDTGVTAIVLTLCSYFGFFHSCYQNIVELLISLQDDSGCWFTNDEAYSSEYTFEVTLWVLKSLHVFQENNHTNIDLEESIRKGREYLLNHHLFLKDGQLIKPGWTTFSFPPYWFYDVLSALEYFCESHTKADDRMQPAVDLLRKKRAKDGKWKAARNHSGKTWVDLDRPGQPGKWNTLRALRVLKWWQNQ